VRRVLAVLLAALLTLAWAAPASADVQYVDLYLIATLDQPAYLAGEEMTAHVTIINSGTIAATGVVLRSRGDMAFDWGDLADTGPGIEVPPGGQVDVTVHAPIDDPGDGVIERLLVDADQADIDMTGNEVTLSAFVTEKHADLDVTVFLDADRDGVLDPGEVRKGVEVELSGGLEHEQHTTRTDETGVAHFPGISGGQYQQRVKLPVGWHNDTAQPIRVRGGANKVQLQATHNDFTGLRAAVSLDKATYAPGEPVHERVTLTNTGHTDIVGIVAHCGGYGRENALYSMGWGELAPDDKSGAVVRAGETRTWEFDDVVPPQAWDYGYVLLRCDFSPTGAHDGPLAEARGTVPGGEGTISGRLVDTAGAPLGGITLLMLDTVSGRVVARVESAADGRFQFPSLPADLYELRPVGPWRLGEAVFDVQVMAGTDHPFDPLVLEPGPVQDDPEKKPEPTPVKVVPAPAPQASPVRPTALADTGADVAELAALGALLVALGLLLVRRRSYS
jgi:LPXTG-motif cell wall-anchored protein